MNEDCYSFYFLDEKKFFDETEDLKNDKKKVKLMSTVGKIKSYDINTKLGEIVYESKILNTNFQRVSHYIQLDQIGLYFFYGFLNYVDDKIQFVCEYILPKPMEKFDRLEYQKYITFKRDIIEKCKKMKEQNEIIN